jgi:drug/metabolite transporter (DMT)-like permease
VRSTTHRGAHRVCAISSRCSPPGCFWGAPSPSLSQILGQSLVAYALAGLPAAFASVALLLQLTIAATLAWAILGEALGPWRVEGGAVVLAGVVLARSGSRRG